MPVFTRSDRHALGAFFAQPKVFTTAEFTLLERAAPTLALWHLEEEELASPEIAEHSTASRIGTLCDHASAFELDFPAIRIFTSNLTQVATTTVAKAAHNTPWPNSACTN
jgi:hypothetical protein